MIRCDEQGVPCIVQRIVDRSDSMNFFTITVTFFDDSEITISHSEIRKILKWKRYTPLSWWADQGPGGSLERADEFVHDVEWLAEQILNRKFPK